MEERCRACGIDLPCSIFTQICFLLARVICFAIIAAVLVCIILAVTGASITFVRIESLFSF